LDNSPYSAMGGNVLIGVPNLSRLSPRPDFDRIIRR
jgi:hypothetical protein